MSSAMFLVFSTPELLELVLLDLPLPSLLLTRQISSTFNNLINSSPLIQQKLFFRPGPDATIKDWHANPLLRKFFAPFFAAPEGRFSTPRDYSILTMLEWTRNEQTRNAFLRKEASWRNMGIISHSPASLRVAKWTHGQASDREYVATVHFRSGKGVTMGIVYDIVHSFLATNSVASFAVAFNRHGEGKDAAAVGMTLYLDMTFQCCIYESDDEGAMMLRSEGEEITAYGLEWNERRKWTDDDLDEHVPDMWDEWKSDLDVERGALDEGEWEEWRSCRGE